ncbi:E3 ubiquitin-protein ligase MARCH6 [Chanodichthys erythropterus]|uniref:E3 ubiquitin-protein ligase MARCH6 n=1 Tax=Megalobrama amblycephala TaxID=75352 RepID=UPI00201404F0|nr:E3 ubiquitin-protein ligase MARCH6 [Megalobrama amblycephala]XP_051739126.1 E3 ubiquitin-protein ligase MARCH6 [Ctenopharyngodon idella]
MDTAEEADICRVCRSEGTQDKPLYHPCVCTGSIKFIHQECLVQWLKHSRKEYCELCKHRFAFTPIYSPDMPSRLPVQDIFAGLVTSIGTAIRYWFHYTLVAFAWLGVVPLTACRIYKCLFTGSVSSLLTLPLDMLSTENLLADCLQGCFVVTCTLCAFISLVWLREQIVHGGAPLWLEQNQQQPANAAGPPNEAPGQGNGGAENQPMPAPAEPPGENAAAAEAPDLPADPAEEMELDNDDEEDGGAEDVADANNGAQDDMNWNALEWDRAAEELTWERMLGLDGSLVFLEHVFWVVSLNTLFILVFAFCPYHIGHFSVVGLGFEEYVRASHFEGLITTIVGYVLLAITLIVCHGLAALVRFQRSRRLLGVCYIVVKVSLLVVVEIGVFPLICGWWLDICSLEMFDASLKDRELSFESAPGTTMFLHWLVGMVYVFYFASFILLLREVLRPGVLWFLRNLNDPDFNPVQEMIHLPIYRHLRRFILSVVVFGSIVLLMLWLPIRIIKHIFPSFLPYNVMLYSDAPVSELSLELLLLQVVLPALLEQGHTRQWLKGLVRAWTVTAGYLLDLHSYLLGDQEDNENNANQQANNINQQARNNAIPVVGEGLHAAHQAILQQGGPVGFQPYHRPMKFPLRIVLLILFMCLTLLLASLVCLTLPVFTGRWLMSFWTGSAKIHELYTAACGLYVCWLSIRAITVLLAWMPQGRRVILLKVQEWTLMIMKTLIVAVLLAGVIPLLLGLLFELVIVAPLRVPLDQTPLFYPWQDWALGVLHAKIIAAITLMGPQWWLKTVIEQVYANGIRNIDLHFIIRKLAAPVIAVLLLSLCIPYVISVGIVPLIGVTMEMQNLVQRRIYPFLLMVVVLMGILSFQIRQFKRLYEHIKNDKYLVGQRLVNYERKAGKASTTTHSSSVQE